MIKIENHCCACATPAYPCLGSTCPNRHVAVYYCDKCKTEIEGDVYDDGEQELCESCLLDKYRKDD